jgi:hypothetical protein
MCTFCLFSLLDIYSDRRHMSVIAVFNFAFLYRVNLHRFLVNSYEELEDRLPFPIVNVDWFCSGQVIHVMNTGNHPEQHKRKRFSGQHTYWADSKGFLRRYVKPQITAVFFLFLRDSPPHMRADIDPVSEMLCSLVFLEYRTMDKVQKEHILRPAGFYLTP